MICIQLKYCDFFLYNTYIHLSFSLFSSGFIYYPVTNKCYSAYRQGPCSAGQYLVLPPRKVIPECVQNPCRNDGKVPFRSSCHELDKTGPCQLPELATVVGINETTLLIDCLIPISLPKPVVKPLESRLGEEEKVEKEEEEQTPRFEKGHCFIGGKRSYGGMCAVV